MLFCPAPFVAVSNRKIAEEPPGCAKPLVPSHLLRGSTTEIFSCGDLAPRAAQQTATAPLGNDDQRPPHKT